MGAKAVAERGAMPKYQQILLFWTKGGGVGGGDEIAKPNDHAVGN